MRIVQRPLARFDLIETADFLEEVYNLDRADAFLFASRQTFELLAKMPEIGSPRPNHAVELPELRQWQVKGFEDYLIFYIPLEQNSGVEIIRVLHGKRNIATILEDEQA